MMGIGLEEEEEMDEEEEGHRDRGEGGSVADNESLASYFSGYDQDHIPTRDTGRMYFQSFARLPTKSLEYKSAFAQHLAQVCLHSNMTTLQVLEGMCTETTETMTTGKLNRNTFNSFKIQLITYGLIFCLSCDYN